MNKKVAIVGGGACALVLACELDYRQFDVEIFEKNAALARKFLVAGEGGLNLTHSEEPDSFIKKYTPPGFLKPYFDKFNNQDFIKWLNKKGVETYVGSSGRVFPVRGIKPITVLNTLLQAARNNRVRVHTNAEWKGFSNGNELCFDVAGQTTSVRSDIVIFCLGGASWPVTGSTGDWVRYFIERNILVNAFESSNCSFNIAWPLAFIDTAAGKALKNCSITCSGKTVQGEVVLTASGLEGSGIYPLSPQIRVELKEKGVAQISIDLKPSLSIEEIAGKIKSLGPGSYTKNIARALNLNPLQVSLLKTTVSKQEFLDVGRLAPLVKKLSLNITGCGPIGDAISTVGGIALNELSPDFELRKMPGFFAIGEMLDYDAPTGGYLLQSCFTMAKGLAHHLNNTTER